MRVVVPKGIIQGVLAFMIVLDVCLLAWFQRPVPDVLGDLALAVLAVFFVKKAEG
jgi:hypothetical protein